MPKTGAKRGVRVLSIPIILSTSWFPELSFCFWLEKEIISAHLTWRFFHLHIQKKFHDYKL